MELSKNLKMQISVLEFSKYFGKCGKLTRISLHVQAQEALLVETKSHTSKYYLKVASEIWPDGSGFSLIWLYIFGHEIIAFDINWKVMEVWDICWPEPCLYLQHFWHQNKAFNYLQMALDMHWTAAKIAIQWYIFFF